tara:strand:+ start:256 stop:1083 length:828 start_codon:yes stop_codon:yes gene_type:complete
MRHIQDKAMASQTSLPHARGILKQQKGFERFQLFRQAPPADLVPWIENFWAVRWDLRDQPPYTQQILPHPNVGVSIEDKASRIVGPVSGIFSYTLEEQGVVFGTKFKPGAFVDLWNQPMSSLTDKEYPLEHLFGPRAHTLEADVLSKDTEEEMTLLMADFWRSVLTSYDPIIEDLCSLIDLLANTPTLLKVEDLAAQTDRSVRSLQRLFKHYLGVSPKWAIKRYRLLEAAERIANAPDTDLSQLALELEYFDQAHFTRDFKSIIGVPPARYASQL